MAGLEQGRETRSASPTARSGEGSLARLGGAFTDWAEHWFPDAYVFVCIAVAVVALAALANGAAPLSIAKAFGDGFWSLVLFTMQMAMVVIGGYVVASSPPVARLIKGLAAMPRSGPGAVAFIAAMTMLSSMLSWGLSLIFGALLVREIARRAELKMDYRAAGAAAYLGLGATWALGLSSSAAQLQANPGSLPKSLLPITGVIPFKETIFLWQSQAIFAVLFVVSIIIAWLSAPSPQAAVTAEELRISLEDSETDSTAVRTRPGEWFEHSPLLTLIIVALGAGWLYQEFATKDPIVAISNLNTYNLLFLMVGALLHWRPRNFLKAVYRAVPATAGVLIQFPLYGAIATMLTAPKGFGDVTLADRIAHAFVTITNTETFPVAMALYSAVLGFLVPSGGGKWILEAPYVMQAANDLKVNLGWAVQIYNTAEALPNLINPFWMLPLLGVLGLKAREIVGFTFMQFIVHFPIVLFLLWYFAKTLPYHPPVLP